MLACVVLFGFSTSLHMAMIARCCVGLLNGNVGILRTVVAELVPEKELQPQAFGILPLAWNIGSIIGPAIGGFLSEPAQKYPEVFPKESFFDRNPWALPNLFIATISLVGFCLGILFLEETLAERKYRYDPGRDIGRRIEQFLGFKSESPIARPQLDAHDRDRSPDATLTWSQILTKSSVQLILLYVTLAIHNISYEQLLSVFLATKIHAKSNPIRLPFHLPGGFALDTSDIGLVFASIGVVVIIVQFVFYPPLAKKYGKIRLLTVAAILDPIAYNAIPYTLSLYKPYTANGSNWMLWVTWAAIVIMRGTTTVFALTSCVILITNTASSPKALGTLNGLSTSLAALGLSLGPSTFGWLFSTGQKSSWTTIPWVGLSLVALSMWVWIPDAEDLERDDKNPISQHSSNSDADDQISARD
ncbi:hypothetical protein H072_10173 [Dactylellina haptotyla CBS 200.50]|uniref:Major facilitator superfamily (MFS) profile domain-containing protein n=1 Tax=Dactylellina haptotyla (strain CBS 200.50) TaxID=1284197 RepID=S8BAX4_DACHA|nr:hypothetical protein H072_10173 [Dactylellina haptotyla CBS 200.50]